MTPIGVMTTADLDERDFHRRDDELHMPSSNPDLKG